jgi:hypothetical protein
VGDGGWGRGGGGMSGVVSLWGECTAARAGLGLSQLQGSFSIMRVPLLAQSVYCQQGVLHVMLYCRSLVSRRATMSSA